MQSVQINLARQAGINAAESSRVALDREGRIVSTSDGLPANPYASLDDVARCAFEHGARLVFRMNRLARDNKTILAYARKMPDLYTPGYVFPIS